MIQSWTFQKKVNVGFAVMVGLVALTTAIAVYALSAAAAIKDNVLSVNAENMIEAARLEAAVHKGVAAYRGYIISTEERFLSEQAAADQQFADVLPRLDRTVYTEEGKRRLNQIRQAHQAWKEGQERLIDLRSRKDGFQAAASHMRDEMNHLRNQLVQEIDAFVMLERRLLEQARIVSSAEVSTARILLVAIGSVAVLFALGAAIFLGRALSRQISAAVQHVQSSSAELQTSANQQSSGAREATTAMNEITTTVSELLATSRQIAGSAQQVTHIAEETLKAAQSGDQTTVQSREAIEGIRRHVDNVVTHMLDLGKKSQQIGGVLDIINELAEQTNILSINATIEAAGAGESGRRFAAVGEEIRKLADRVAGSTKESRALIEEIHGAVHTTILATEAGSKAVDAGLRRFEEVIGGFKEIAGMVATTTQAAREIGLSTKQQMTAVEQVNAAMGGAAQATREAEASSVQTLQTATQLAQLSHNLSRLVRTQSAA